MQTALLRYADSGGTIFKRQYEVIAVRGFDEPDAIQMVPNRIVTLFDGSRRTQFVGFRRVPTITFRAMHDAEAIQFLQRFIQNNTRSIYIGNIAGQEEEIILALDQSDFESKWIKGIALNKSFEFQFAENAIRNAWTDYTPASGIDIMYIKKKVKIIGTQESPEEFTTNSGKLATMETGLSYPSISLLSWVVSVDTVPYQDAKVNQVGDVVNTGTNLTFSLAVSGAGSPSPDGYYYADIIIGLQPRP